MKKEAKRTEKEKPLGEIRGTLLVLLTAIISGISIVIINSLL
jgi:hypothetical protein